MDWTGSPFAPILHHRSHPIYKARFSCVVRWLSRNFCVFRVSTSIARTVPFANGEGPMPSVSPQQPVSGSTAMYLWVYGSLYLLSTYYTHCTSFILTSTITRVKRGFSWHWLIGKKPVISALWTIVGLLHCGGHARNSDHGKQCLVSLVVLLLPVMTLVAIALVHWTCWVEEMYQLCR